MCLRFRATVYRTTGPATAPNHPGESPDPYINPDCPVGTLLALDKAGNWYMYRADSMVDRVGTHDLPGSWPKKLFRDYWRSVRASKSSPYLEAIAAAPKQQLN